MFLGLLVPGLPIAAAAPGEDGAAGEGAAAGMARYHRWMRSQLDAIEADLPRVSLVAERAAMRYATGTWQIAAAGDYGVVGEAVGRSGGIMAMKWGYPFNYLDLDAETNAIVLFALRADQYEKYLREAKAALAGDNVFVIAMGPAPLLERAEADGFPLDAKLPVHAAGTGGLFPGSAPDTWRVATAPVASMALLWTWTAEFVAACTRQGAMPVMHESYAVEGAEARAKERAKRRFEAEAPDPVARGALGRAYLAALRELLGRFDEAERPALKRVVAEARAHRRAGGRLFAFASSLFSTGTRSSCSNSTCPTAPDSWNSSTGTGIARSRISRCGRGTSSGASVTASDFTTGRTNAGTRRRGRPEPRSPGVSPTTTKRRSRRSGRRGSTS